MTETMCLANINRAGKRRRAALGTVVLAAAATAHLVHPPEALSAQSALETGLAFFGWLCVTQAAADT